VKTLTASPGLLVKLLVPLIVIPILGIAPNPRDFNRSLSQASQFLDYNLPFEASAAIVRAAAYFPWRADLWEAAGRYALQAGEIQAALQDYHQASLLTPLSAATYEDLGDAMLLAGDPETAIHYWEAAIQLGSSPGPIYTRLFAVYQQQHDYAAEAASLQALVKLQPGEAENAYQLGLLLAAIQPEASLAYLTQAAAIDPSLASMTQTLQRAITSARLADDPAYTQLAAGRALASLGEWQLAAEAFRRATQQNPTYAEAWAFLGEALQQLDEDEPANLLTTTSNLLILPSPAHPSSGYAELEKAYQLDPRSLSANTFLAYYWQRQMRNDLALVYLHAAADLDPNNVDIQIDIGDTLARLGNLTVALKYYQHATLLAPRDPVYWRYLATFSIKYEFQVRETGLPAARQAVLLSRDDPASLDTIAQVYILLNDPLSAQRFLVRALQKDANYAPAHLHMGLFYLLEGDTDQAYREINLARSLAPGTPLDEQARRILQSNFP
jgi:tetratricopeptide (TPR) repeat protein